MITNVSTFTVHFPVEEPAPVPAAPPKTSRPVTGVDIEVVKAEVPKLILDGKYKRAVKSVKKEKRNVANEKVIESLLFIHSFLLLTDREIGFVDGGGGG